MSSYIPIASQTLASAQASVTFNSIPTTLNGKTLRDLVLVVRADMSGTDMMAVRFNGDTGNNYNDVYAHGNGSAVGSSADTNYNRIFLEVLNNNSTGKMALLHIMDYAATNKHKSTLGRGSSPNGSVQMVAGRWASTAAITSITLLQFSSANYNAGSTFSLYGIEG